MCTLNEQVEKEREREKRALLPMGVICKYQLSAHNFITNHSYRVACRELIFTNSSYKKVKRRNYRATLTQIFKRKLICHE